MQGPWYAGGPTPHPTSPVLLLFQGSCQHKEGLHSLKLPGGEEAPRRGWGRWGCC